MVKRLSFVEVGIICIIIIASLVSEEIDEPFLLYFSFLILLIKYGIDIKKYSMDLTVKGVLARQMELISNVFGKPAAVLISSFFLAMFFVFLTLQFVFFQS